MTTKSLIDTWLRRHAAIDTREGQARKARLKAARWARDAATGRPNEDERRQALYAARREATAAKPAKPAIILPLPLSQGDKLTK